ncbi:hypothetical protein GOODEAATRI_001531, partial [Goodea atripinnis]
KCEVDVLNWVQLMLPRPQDLAVVCFTSGTTGSFCHAVHCNNFMFIYPGKPKGAMITHGNIASNTSSVIKILEVCLHFHLFV